MTSSSSACRVFGAAAGRGVGAGAGAGAGALFGTLSFAVLERQQAKGSSFSKQSS